MYHHDTIVALATPPGIGAIAVIRLSGADAITIANQSFFSKKGTSILFQKKTHSISFGQLMHQGDIIDEVVASIYRNPQSYTGEDVVEISCHASPYIIEQIIKLYLQAGARLANPGEFTLRAFLNNKLALTQAEAVADVIASDSAASHKLAMQQMRGGFGNDIKALRQQLIDFAALLELELDFSEEDVEFANRKQFVDLIEHVKSNLKPLIESFRLGNVIKNGVPVAIAGKPNAGKSTLLNGLLNEERSIVSHIAGTTRDTVEEVLNINGVSFRFIDTAGLRHTTDEIEQIGVERSYAKIKQASLLLYVFDASAINNEADLENEINEAQKFAVPYLLIANKSDLCSSATHEILAQNSTVFAISAKMKTGIEELKNGISELILGNSLNNQSVVITNLRHYEGLTKSYESLNNVVKGVAEKLNTELLAFELRNALQSLGELSGEISNDDILGSIFTRFCIGK